LSRDSDTARLLGLSTLSNFHTVLDQFSRAHLNQENQVGYAGQMEISRKLNYLARIGSDNVNPDIAISMKQFINSKSPYISTRLDSNESENSVPSIQTERLFNKRPSLPGQPWLTANDQNCDFKVFTAPKCPRLSEVTVDESYSGASRTNPSTQSSMINQLANPESCAFPRPNDHFLPWRRFSAIP
uniref:ANF_receptor domain-containing protein n=1 Tax=Echinostoma caproni TaxID=27848 RepID=A0A183A486_9TREM